MQAHAHTLSLSPSPILYIIIKKTYREEEEKKCQIADDKFQMGEK